MTTEDLIKIKECLQLYNSMIATGQAHSPRSRALGLDVIELIMDKIGEKVAGLDNIEKYFKDEQLKREKAFGFEAQCRQLLYNLQIEDDFDEYMSTLKELAKIYMAENTTPLSVVDEGVIVKGLPGGARRLEVVVDVSGNILGKFETQ